MLRHCEAKAINDYNMVEAGVNRILTLDFYERETSSYKGEKLKHVVGSCLVGSPNGHGGHELLAVVRIYPGIKIIATCAKNL